MGPFKVFLTVLILVVAGVNCDKKNRTYHPRKTTTAPSACPSFALAELPTDPLAEQNVTREYVLKAWKVGIFPIKTPLLTKFQDLIVKMAQSNSIYFGRVALQFSAWAAAMFPYMRELYPSFCPIAKIINQTVEWRKTQDISIYLKSLDTLSVPALYGHRALTYTVLKQQGCKDVPLPQGLPRDCWENGFAYKLDCLFDLYGELLPWPLYYVVNKLAKSEKFEEKAAAALFGYMMVPQRNLNWARLNTSIPVEYLGLYIASKSNQLAVCCCGDIKQRTSNLVEYLDDTVYSAIYDEKEKINNQCQ